MFSVKLSKTSALLKNLIWIVMTCMFVGTRNIKFEQKYHNCQWAISQAALHGCQNVNALWHHSTAAGHMNAAKG